MNINDYQEFVRQGASSAYTKQLSIIGLVGEVGEVADVIKKESIYTDMSLFVQKYGMSVYDKIIDECGDVLWQYVNLLNQYNLSIEEVMLHNVNKLRARHKNVSVSSNGGIR